MSVVLAKPEQVERSAAAGIHIGAIFVPIWVPLIAYVVTHRSRPFVAAHARQSLVETLVLNVFIGIAMVVSLAYTIVGLYGLYQEGFENADWWSVVWKALLKMGIWWLVMGVLWVVNLFVSIRQAGMAYRGEWPKSAVKRASRG